MDMGESHDEERGMDMWESHDGLPDPGPEGSDEQGSHHLVHWEESALWAGAAPGPVPERGAGPGDSRGRPGPRQERPSGALDLGDSSLSGPGRRPGRGPRPWGFLGRGDPRQLWTRPRSLSLGTFADGPRRWGIPGPAGPSQEWIWKVPFSLKHHGFQRKKTWSAVRGTERKGRWVSPTLEAQGFRPRFVPSPGGKPRAVPFPGHGSDGGPTWGNAAYLWPRPGNWPTITFFGAP